MNEVVQEWFANFANGLNEELLFDVILAANFMDITALVDLTCATVASVLKTQPIKEVQAIFKNKPTI